MSGCEKEVLEWEVDGSAIGALEELDEAFCRALEAPDVTSTTTINVDDQLTSRRLLKRKPSTLSNRPSTAQTQSKPQTQLPFLASSPTDLLYALESLETTALAMTHLPVPIPDFCAHAIITLRRLAPRHVLADFTNAKKRRTGKCAEYARCMKWAGTLWKQNGGCRRGCKNEDEDPDNLPSWHRTSKWFDEKGDGTFMVGGGRAGRREDDAGDVQTLKV